MSEPPDRTACARAHLEDSLEALARRADSQQVDALMRLACLLEGWARRVNLTGHRSLERIVERLIVEAAALLAQLPPLGALADLGSGAGFPGLPIAILEPDWQLTLVEARERRHHFQRAAVRALGLRNVALELGRAEALPARPHPGAVAQAAADPDLALHWMARWTEPGGYLILPTGPTPPRVAPNPEFAFERWIPYQLPLGGPERGVWIARRL